ncbi:hypothetical protein [Gordonia alkanivorans]|uniref:hypothetical protein n=1 Tax=Gordonia alkanivorans TaxID=84096 RepID=UPI001F4E808E|nr:hypothetical protein [Gordonia alkanivorans]
MLQNLQIPDEDWPGQTTSKLAAASRSPTGSTIIGAPDVPETERARSLIPTLAKGFEFDPVMFVDPLSPLGTASRRR